MPVKESMCLQGKDKQDKKKPFFYPLSLYKFPAEGVAQIKVCLPSSRSNYRLVVFLPQDLDHKNALLFWIVVHSRYSQVDNQN